MEPTLTPIADTSKTLARTPLGVIALFIVLVYAFAAMVATWAKSLTIAERTPLIYFLVLFPVLVLVVFAWLVHTGKLLWPGNFANEDNYIKLQTAVREVRGQVSEVDGKVEDIKKIQQESAYQLSRDLLSKRYEVYGQLWSRMRITAIYTTATFKRDDVSRLYEDLTTWYFELSGGLFLPENARNLYHGLQDFLAAVLAEAEWSCDVRPRDPRSIFAGTLSRLSPPFDITELTDIDRLDPKRWRILCHSLATALVAITRKRDVDSGTQIFCAVQQVATIVRTGALRDLRSRLLVNWPETDGHY